MGTFYNWDLEFQYPGFGMHMGYAGDINGDNIDDFWMSSWDDDWRGEVFIYSDPTLSVRNPEIELSIPDFTLQQNYPNPFNAQTVIPFTLNRAGKVALNIFDITGRSVGVQYIEPLQTWFPAGIHEVVWNADGLSSGVYLVRLMVDGKPQGAGTLLHETRKVVLVK
ncbi:MAG: T9SS type A sorting domain-containing protein [FCB group bacterium]|nr:T9SS type A sorting domain-containing protein [FCB group bacterium]